MEFLLPLLDRMTAEEENGFILYAQDSTGRRWHIEILATDFEEWTASVKREQAAP